MSVQALEHLSRELVRLCDNVEKHGLVDYQMGVAEEVVVDCEFYIPFPGILGLGGSWGCICLL